MIVTIHQPNFAPWTGFFDKMTKADVFVLLDTVPFTKGGFQNRVRIKGHGGPAVADGSGAHQRPAGTAHLARWRPTRLKPWRSDHLKTLQTLYGRCQGYETAAAMLEPSTPPGRRTWRICAPT